MAVIWDAESGKRLRTLKNDDRVWSVAFSPDGRSVVTGSYDGMARIWDARRGTQLRTLEHEGWVMSVAFSPGGRTVVAGSYDGMAVIWDASSGKRLRTLKHEDAVRSVAFSPDGRFVVTGSEADTAVIWDAKSGKQLRTLKHKGWVRSAAFSPDGRFVLTGSHDYTATLWSVSLSSGLLLVEQVAGQAMEQFLADQRKLPQSLQEDRARLQADKPAASPRIVKGKYESTSAFERRIEETRANYSARVSAYNLEVAELEGRIEAYYESAPRSLTTGQRNQAIAQAFLGVHGKPQLGNVRYDADAALFFIDLTSSSPLAGDFKRTVAVSVPNSQARAFDERLADSEPEVNLRIDENGVIGWESATITHLGRTWEAKPIGDVAFEPVEMSVPIAQAEVRTLNPAMPQPIALGGVEIHLQEDPELAEMQRQLYELERKRTSQKARAKKKAQTEREISKLQQEIAAHQAALQRSSFEDDLPARLKKARAARPDPRRYLLAVGIGDYDEVPDVPFADRSAELFAETFRKLLGVPKDNTIVLRNGKATGSRILSRLQRILNRLEPEDQLYFYYAGHGAPGLDGKSTYLLPADGDMGGFEDERLELASIYARMAASKAGRIVAFIDACFSGRIAPDKLIFEGVAPLVVVSESGLPDGERMTVLAAGRDSQFSNQYREKGHRLFSYFLIDGLLAGRTDIEALSEHVRSGVEEESRRLGTVYTQEPQLYGDSTVRLKK